MGLKNTYLYVNNVYEFVHTYRHYVCHVLTRVSPPCSKVEKANNSEYYEIYF